MRRRDHPDLRVGSVVRVRMNLVESGVEQCAVTVLPGRVSWYEEARIFGRRVFFVAFISWLTPCPNAPRQAWAC